MIVNVVTKYKGWILQKLAERIVSAGNKLNHTFILTQTPSNDVDCNFYVDMQNAYKMKTSTIDIGMFTHLHENSLNDLQPHYLSADYIVHMTERYYKKFSNVYPTNKMSVLYPAEVINTFNQYKPTIGIFQRGQFIGKGFDFMLRLAEEPILSKFKFKFIGSGWDLVIEKLKKNNIIVNYNTLEDYNIYPEEMHEVDYILIPSLWEGGPMAILEGLACGKPIITSDVGICNEFPVDFIYEPNNINALTGIFNKILTPIENRRKSVENLTFDFYANELIKIIEKLKNEKT